MRIIRVSGMLSEDVQGEISNSKLVKSYFLLVRSERAPVVKISASQRDNAVGFSRLPSTDFLSHLEGAVGYDGGREKQDVRDHGDYQTGRGPPSRALSAVDSDEIDALLDDALRDASDMPMIEDYFEMVSNNNPLHGQGSNSKKIKLSSPQ